MHSICVRKSMCRHGQTASCFDRICALQPRHTATTASSVSQSDHRPVFACFKVPWDGLGASNAQDDEDDDGEGSFQGDLSALSLSVKPSEALVSEAKPDRLHEHSVKVTLSGGGPASFKVFLCENGSNDFKPVSGSRDSTLKDRPASSDDEDTEKALSRWLSVSPPRGKLKDGESKEVRISICMSVPMLQRKVIEASLVFSLSKTPSAGSQQDAKLPMQIKTEPSIFRMPLSILSALGSQAIISDQPLPKPAALPSTPSGLCLPPKEVMAVMQWIIRVSRDEVAGSLRWWPDPLLDSVRKGQDELHELVRYLENGWPMPANCSQMPPRVATVFIFRWLMLLPQPVLPMHICEMFIQERPTVKAALQGVAALPRAIIVCTTSLFAQLSSRHGSGADAAVVQRMTKCLTHEASISDASEQMVNALMSEFRRCTQWPPMNYLAASL